MNDHWQKVGNTLALLDAIKESASSTGAYPHPSRIAAALAVQVASVRQDLRMGKTEAVSQGLVRINGLFELVKNALGTYADPGKREAELVEQRQRTPELDRIGEIETRLQDLFSFALEAAKISAMEVSEATIAVEGQNKLHPRQIFTGQPLHTLRFAALSESGVYWFGASSFRGVGYGYARHPGDLGPATTKSFDHAIELAFNCTEGLQPAGVYWWVDSVPQGKEATALIEGSAGGAFRAAFDALRGTPSPEGNITGGLSPRAMLWDPAIVVMAAIDKLSGRAMAIKHMEDKLGHLVAWNAKHEFSERINTIAVAPEQADAVVSQLKTHDVEDTRMLTVWRIGDDVRYWPQPVEMRRKTQG